MHNNINFVTKLEIRIYVILNLTNNKFKNW